MTKQIINTGTGANSRDGDSLRNAFTKVNANFTELYNLASASNTVDFSAIAHDIIPSINDTYNIGSPDKQWRHLYVGVNTIYINNIPLTVDESGNILVNNTVYRGEQGVPGDNGADAKWFWQGEYNNSAMYTEGSIVTYLGSSYRRNDYNPSNVGFNPTNSDYWSTIAEKGGYGFEIPPNTTFTDLYNNGGATIFNNGGKISLYSNVSNNNDGVEIRVKGVDGDNNWQFKSNGTITFPDDTEQTTAFTGFPDLVVVNDIAPESGILWFNSNEARMYVKYNEQWVDASPTIIPPPDTNPTLESLTFNDASIQTTAWPGTFSYNDLTDKPATGIFVGGGNASTWVTAF